MKLFLFMNSKLDNTDNESKTFQLKFLNQFKKNNKEQRRLQNKRYRERHRDVLNLKKQLEYHKKTYESKLNLFS